MTHGTPAFRSSLLGLLLRRLPVLIAFAALGALAGFALNGAGGTEPAEYESRTLVVATTWELRIEGLSRMVDTVMATNGFSEQIQRADADAFDGFADFDESIEIVPVQDTVAVWLEARAGTPELAQRRANLAGDVLVTELNRLGVDIGTFVVQDRASLPGGPVQAELSMPIMLALGALGGLTVGSGVAVAWPDRERRRIEAEAEAEAEAIHDTEPRTDVPVRSDEKAEDAVGPSNDFGPPRHRTGLPNGAQEPVADQRTDRTSRDRRGPTGLVRRRA